jgi:RIO-like serine/threonine protein kinase
MKRIFMVEVDAENDDYDVISAMQALAEEVVSVNTDGSEYSVVVTEDGEFVFASQG